MAKFSEKTFLNFTTEDHDVSEVMEDFRDSIRQDLCWIGDHFFFYQKSIFDKRVVAMDNVLWMYPCREAPKGRAGHQFYNDVGKLTIYSKEGERMDFLFGTPQQAETLFGMLTSTFAEDHKIITGMSGELQKGLDENGVEGFQKAMQQLQEKYRQQALQDGAE